ncbi:lysophospholipid acyltransferase family protein [Marinobacter alexandrii]|jgi:Kdo2-lipid IVA lauroyltransferase/acyltransferase|uniref:lysophospholipid acyltransferase family protein n=1 Tax=Marinobacter alexandrii TaxID=2570351 RepID=UPI00200004C8|nr:lysophospholipid acyltransferase family protein [Marinobacter alexandrii]MCK2149773.1 lysophospholipid acyltransferase family protein [Marinobacter alexandrii]
MSKLKYFIIAGLLRVVGWLSLGNAQKIGKWIGLLTWKLPTKSRQVTDTNLSICLPDLSDTDRSAMSKASMIQTGQTMMEVPLMWEWPVQKCLNLIKETKGLELIDEAMSSGKGLILLAPHLGNWELVGLFFSSRYKMAALYSPPNMPEFEDYMIKVRGRLGSELVRGDRRGLIRLTSILREGGVAGILPDQSPRGKGNAYAPFFGMEVRTMTLVSKLIQKTDANALITYAERLPDASGFRIVVKRTEPGLGEKDPVVATTALNRSIEHCVLDIPEQYQWEYKRMRHRPPGEANPYKPDQVC